MPNIGEIIVNEYRNSFGGSQTAHRQTEATIKRIITEELHSITMSKIDAYNIGREAHTFNGTRANRLLIFFDGTFEGSPEKDDLESPAVINGVQTTHKKFLSPTGVENNVVITSEEGLELAEYSPRREVLNILFNLFGEYTEVEQDLFRYIMKKFEELVWYPKTLENSWIHSQNKEQLTARFTDRMKRQRAEDLERDRRSLRNNEQTVEDFRRELKRSYDNIYRLRRHIETEESNLNNVSSQLIKDLDLIVEHPKVKDLHIIDGVFHVYTEDIYCYASDNKRYYIGKCKFTMKLENTEVRFYNLNNARQGYWTSQDPHPHVDGNNGNACLGSVASTIAELCSRNEAYALALTCIDFLENANLGDVAGRRVTNWDEVDEDNNIIRRAGDEEIHQCEHCENHHPEGDMYGNAYMEVDGDGDLCDMEYICNECRDNEFYYSEIFQETLHESIDDSEYDDSDEEDDDVEDEF